jgi:hypothetical protein
MEHIMFADDRPGHPMTFVLRAEFAGRIDAERFVEAFEAARARHPLLGSVIAGSPEMCTADLCWVPSHARPWIAIDEEDTTRGLVSIDPTREVPVRARMRQGSERSVVDFVFHHSATDGMGALQFLEDLLGHYGRLDGERLPLRDLDPRRLAERGSFRQEETPLQRRLLSEVARGLRFVSCRARPLARPETTNADTQGASIRCEFSRPEIGQLKAASRAVNGTINDLLLARLFETLDGWNRSHGSPGDVRLAMPINLRGPADAQLPAANVITIALLDRSARDCAGPSLLQGLIEETQRLKTERAGRMMLWAAHVLGHLPGGVQQLMAPRWPLACGATAVLSNLGPVFSRTRFPRDPEGRLRVGGLTLKRVEVLPPVRPGTALSLGVVTYGGRMTVSVQHDASHLSDRSARTLVESYADRLHVGGTP